MHGRRVRACVADAISQRPGHVAQVDASEEAPEHPSEIIGLLRAGPWIERHGARHGVVQRKQSHVRVARFRVGAPHRRLDRIDGSPSKRRSPAPELHEQDGHRKHVGGGGQFPPRHLLGRHVAGRSEHAMATRGGRHGLGDPEVDDFDLSLFVDHHVARCDVAVDHAHPPVRVIERAAHFDSRVGPLVGRETPGGSPQKVSEAHALDELHGQKIRPEFDAEFVHGHDVGVGEGDRRLGLLDEAPDEFVVAGELVANLLDHEALLEATRSSQRRQHHARHSAARELSLEDVLAEYLRVHWETGAKRLP